MENIRELMTKGARAREKGKVKRKKPKTLEVPPGPRTPQELAEIQKQRELSAHEKVVLRYEKERSIRDRMIPMMNAGELLPPEDLAVEAVDVALLPLELERIAVELQLCGAGTPEYPLSRPVRTRLCPRG